MIAHIKSQTLGGGGHKFSEFACLFSKFVIFFKFLFF